MRSVIFIIALLVAAVNAFAQPHQLAEGDFGVGPTRGSLSLAYVCDWRLGAKQRISVGAGLRFTSFLGANVYYITAPAVITSGSTSPLIFFKENIVDNLDSLLIKSPQVNALNLSINLGYQFNKRWFVGFNIDAIGFSFGGSRRANYINGYTGKNVKASPTAFNVLLISDNDRGTLNSEMYAKYYVNERWAIKLGAQFLFTEYTTDSKVQKDPRENDRFRNKSLMAGLGVSYKIK